MSRGALLITVDVALKCVPVIFLVAILVGFGTLSPRFLTVDNLAAILTQSSWLVIVALGVNLVLLTAGVDLSVGAAMYLAAVVTGLAFAMSPVWISLSVAILIGAAFGAMNGLLIVKLQLPAFIVTLATIFIGRGLALHLSSTKVIVAGRALADFGRAELAGVPVPLVLACAAFLLAGVLYRATPFGPYVRSVGADREGARRAGVPAQAITWSVYCLSGAFAGFGGFVALSQSSAASGSFGQNAEFLAIAAAVLGGTSLFGGRGTLWAPVAGGILITTVQNGLVTINANPYVYPVITGGVILLAALLDSLRLSTLARLQRRMFTAEVPATALVAGRSEA